MKEEKSEIISKEEVERVLKSLNKVEEEHPADNDSKLDFARVKETISSFEGCPVQTVVGVSSTTLLLLPSSALAIVLDMGNQILKAKLFSELVESLSECSEEEAPESPKE